MTFVDLFFPIDFQGFTISIFPLLWWINVYRGCLATTAITATTNKHLAPTTVTTTTTATIAKDTTVPKTAKAIQKLTLLLNAATTVFSTFVIDVLAAFTPQSSSNNQE